MTKGEVLKKLEAWVLGIIRVQTAQDLVQIAKALHAGGLSCLEITMTTPGALRAIEEAREELPDVLMGGGDGARCGHGPAGDPSRGPVPGHPDG